MSHKMLFIVNPHAAQGRSGKRWPDLQMMLRRVLGDFDLRMTEAPGQATQICREAIDSGVERIVSVGGDGTNNEIINGFWDVQKQQISQSASLSLFATGTGSDFSRTLNSSSRIRELAESLKNSQERLIDLGRAYYIDEQGQQSSRFFLNVASLGLSAEVVRAVNAGKRGGRLAYSLATLSSMFHHQRPTLQINYADAQKSYKDLNMLAVANGAFFGGGMHIAPNAVLDDGAFDLVSVWGWTPLQFVLKASKVFAGTHLDLPGVDELRGIADLDVKILQSETPVHIELDGENVGQLPARFEILPKALRLQV